MCGTCGCADRSNKVQLVDLARGKTSDITGAALQHVHAEHGHVHHHDHGHQHDHDHHHHNHGYDHHDHDHGDEPHVHGAHGEVIPLEVAVLAKNDRIAARNRGWFEGRGVLALNLVSSPGAGKTTLLERTVKALAGRVEVCVIEGDQMTTNDAERIVAAGARAVQINTGAGCHLEADMIAQAVASLDPAPNSVLFIENVGNLVCPAMFDLGERMKVAVISTTEGEDKPEKYPHMFRAAEIVLINKIDLAPHVDFDEARCVRNLIKVNPTARVIKVSARTGEGMDDWLGAIEALRGKG